VEHLALQYNKYSVSSEWNDEADREQWRELLGSFGSIKTLSMSSSYELVEQLSRALQPAEGESPTELLPELQELSYSRKGAPHNAFTSFIDARQKAGRPIAVVYT
jgi:hypothetical protein